MWESVVADAVFNSKRELQRIDLYPITLGFGGSRPQRGRPLPAGGRTSTSWTIGERLWCTRKRTCPTTNTPTATPSSKSIFGDRQRTHVHCVSEDIRATERIGATLIFQFSNILNHFQPANPTMNIDSPSTWGVITNQATSANGLQARQMEIGLRIRF
jgi:hypothetical protein